MGTASGYKYSAKGRRFGEGARALGCDGLERSAGGRSRVCVHTPARAFLSRDGGFTAEGALDWLRLDISVSDGGNVLPACVGARG